MNRTTTRKGMIVFIWTMIFALSASLSFAQTARTIKGQVIDEKDLQPIPGAIVKIKGTTTGTATDNEGNFSIEAKNGDVLLISFLGYNERSVTIGASNSYNIKLSNESKSLEEVVVIGYGVQKKKLVTGANMQVKGDDLHKQSTTNALQALQGQAAGVQITSVSGQPGDPLSVIIRGKGTVGSVSPLYVVDGVQTGDISYLNPADIESVDILKDAASAAIYGSQSANGVVLVTTKSGKVGQKAQITFDAYFGQQSLAKKAQLLNASEYATLMNEAAFNSGKAPYFSNGDISQMGAGTDWLGEMFVDQAPTSNYSFGANGGSEFSSYSASLAYTNQQGIVGGKDLSNYERYSIRLNSDHKLYKNIITLGENVTFSYVNNNGIGTGGQYNNTLRGAFATSPFVPMYDENGEFYDNSLSTWNNGEANPYAQMYYNNQNRNNNQRLLGNIYLGAEPIKGLRFRTSVGLDYASFEGRSFNPIYKLSIYSFNNASRVFQSMNKGQSLTWDNQLSYNFKLNNNHAFEVMAGTSSFQSSGSGLNAGNSDLIFDDLNHAWLTNATNRSNASAIGFGGSAYSPEKRMSYFGRLTYNYKEKYMINTTLRGDGSSRFAEGHRWGFFPSVSAGWVASNEDFMKNSSWLNFFKLRASWGQVGNQNIAPYLYLSPISFANTNYIFGSEEGQLVPGSFPSQLGNPNLKWETSEQTNIGFDANVLNNKLTINADFYIKKTKDWLIAAPVIASTGFSTMMINGGDVKNSGVELALTYKDRAGQFGYSIGVNGAYNKNEVGQIPTADGIVHGSTNSLYANSGEFYRAQNGYAMGYFWGLKTDGVFQTAEEATAYQHNGKRIQPDAVAGDVKYVDRNNDGQINDQDKTMIGNPNPDFTFGITLGADFKGFDFSLQASGVAGNDLVQSWRDQSSSKGNYSAAMLDRWHGEGSSNSLPRLTEDNRNWTTFSDLYVHKGDYLKINNVTLGYDFSHLTKNSYLSKLRFYFSVLNLYTFTSYNGMDPEIGYSDSFASGIDLGYYPRPRTIMFGANIKF
ncbi:SusC/RagA family TonB-linked outer membrane protein [Solitalea longa]|uniref:SusC/RagA family TonB-linked outer membrane protein n=1 Tax=Solitalea longa TaxID=2079460 RepID=A0A2S5A4J4_9SPHI|nr:TonB-dependent receptor [Solitalea longa]POY37465.1 SusC/RagA family TonB-linked outer membrane protein [Solitalea longa]